MARRNRHGNSFEKKIPGSRWKSIWFRHKITKYAFLPWLVTQNRLATGDRMLAWNIGANLSCVLCQNVMESRDHLFFECSYSGEVWPKLMWGLPHSSFASLRSELVMFIKSIILILMLLNAFIIIIDLIMKSIIFLLDKEYLKAFASSKCFHNNYWFDNKKHNSYYNVLSIKRKFFSKPSFIINISFLIQPKIYHQIFKNW